MNFISLIVVILALCALVASALDPIPEDTKKKLDGEWFQRSYNKVKKNKDWNKDCFKATIEVIKEDGLKITSVRTDHETKEKSTFDYVGKRVDDGSTSNYEWKQTDPEDDDSYINYTLLGVTEKFAVFLQKDYAKDLWDIETLYVYTKDKTLSDDDKKAIEKIEKDKKINFELSPDQNFNC